MSSMPRYAMLEPVNPCMPLINILVQHAENPRPSSPAAHPGERGHFGWG
jgi:hypothetical protein